MGAETGPPCLPRSRSAHPGGAPGRSHPSSHRQWIERRVDHDAKWEETLNPLQHLNWRARTQGTTTMRNWLRSSRYVLTSKNWVGLVRIELTTSALSVLRS